MGPPLAGYNRRIVKMGSCCAKPRCLVAWLETTTLANVVTENDTSIPCFVTVTSDYQLLTFAYTRRANAALRDLY